MEGVEPEAGVDKALDGVVPGARGLGGDQSLEPGPSSAVNHEDAPVGEIHPGGIDGVAKHFVARGLQRASAAARSTKSSAGVRRRCSLSDRTTVAMASIV